MEYEATNSKITYTYILVEMANDCSGLMTATTMTTNILHTIFSISIAFSSSSSSSTNNEVSTICHDDTVITDK